MATSDIQGLNIGEYDQVIALSQDCINASLKYRIENFSEWASNLNKTFPDLECSIKGSLEDPSVELIDLPNGGDGALFRVTLGKNSVFKIWGRPYGTQYNPYDQPVEIKVGGSTVAFELSFSLEKQPQIPENVRKQIEDPGSYTVSQLTINFSHASLTTFKANASKFNGFDTLYESNGRLVAMIAAHLVDLGKSNRTALGYAMTALKPEIHNHSGPTYPPTAVRLQTMYYRPSGNQSQESRSDSRNAFLFTEMCRNRSLPSTDLSWTSNWIVPPHNGALVINRRVLWDGYFVPFFEDLNHRIRIALNNAVLKTEFAKEMGFENSGWQLTETPDPTLPLGSFAPLHQGLHWGPIWRGRKGNGKQYEITTNIVCDIHRAAGSPNILYQCMGSVHGRVLNPSEYTIALEYTFTFNYLALIKMVAIVGGKLRTVVEDLRSESDTRLNVSVTGGSDGGYRQRLEDGLRDSVRGKGWSSYADAELKKVQFNLSMEKAFDLPFCMPGGTTFDFKNPIFLPNGDFYTSLSILLREDDSQEAIDNLGQQAS